MGGGPPVECRPARAADPMLSPSGRGSLPRPRHGPVLRPRRLPRHGSRGRSRGTNPSRHFTGLSPVADVSLSFSAFSVSVLLVPSLFVSLAGGVGGPFGSGTAYI